MSDLWSIEPIAKIITDFPDKFGVPRQSGLVDTLRGAIYFKPQYRNSDALHGLEGFSHLWIIWGFSESVGKGWSPMVRPPRLGGNVKMGVFATRSPFRPNPLALSVVKIEQINLHTVDGPVIYVSGVDMKNGSPIFDIKPYIPYSDSITHAKGGFTDQFQNKRLKVEFPEHLLLLLPEPKRQTIIDVLSLDPRPSYQDDPDRIYTVAFAGFDMRFTIKAKRATVVEVIKIENKNLTDG